MHNCIIIFISERFPTEILLFNVNVKSAASGRITINVVEACQILYWEFYDIVLWQWEVDNQANQGIQATPNITLFVSA